MSVTTKLLLSLSFAGVSAFALPAFAKPSINDVQTCQAQLDFVDAKLASISKYDKTKVKTVRSGLQAYNAFLQSEHITPGLSAYTGGDAAKNKDFQDQIDAYKATVVAGLNKRYPQPRVFMDHAVAINNCYSSAPMDAAGTAMMTEALQTFVELAKEN